jgi:hypothetical protein
MYRQSLREVGAMKHGTLGRHWKSTVRAIGVLLLGAALCPSVRAQMVKTTLPELVNQSGVIFIGHVHEADARSPVSTNDAVQFDSTELFKGAATVQGVISMCNYHPDSEWPNLSRLKGDHVIFASPNGSCLKLTVGYRSVATVTDGVVNTSGITGQPLRQRLSAFSARIRSLVLLESQHESR